MVIDEWGFVLYNENLRIYSFHSFSYLKGGLFGIHIATLITQYSHSSKNPFILLKGDTDFFYFLFFYSFKTVLGEAQMLRS